MSGFDRVPKPKSLLTQKEGFVSLRVLGRHGRIQTRSHVLRIVADLVGEHAADKVCFRFSYSFFVPWCHLRGPSMCCTLCIAMDLAGVRCGGGPGVLCCPGLFGSKQCKYLLW